MIEYFVAAAVAATSLDPLTLGRQAQTDFEGEGLEALWNRFTPEMRKIFPQGLTDVAMVRVMLREKQGAQQGEAQELAWRSPTLTYVRRATYASGIYTMTWSFDAAGRISGMVARPEVPPAPNPHEGYQVKTDLRLPFEGAWTVFWGGRTVVENYHATTPDQRFAMDLVMVRDGATHTGDGKRNEQYFCFRQPISAPAAGTVVEAIDGLPDQTPGQMDSTHAAGNHVLLDLGNHEYALLAHLANGSVAVKTGQKVARGTRLGLCGNSGNTSEPHLHFHLQDGPKPFEGDGLPMQLRRFKQDGKPVERGEPTRGHVIEPLPG